MTNKRLFGRRTMQLSGLVLTLISVITWVSPRAPGLASRVAQAQFDFKEAMTAHLVELEGNIADLKEQVAARPYDKSLAAQLEGAIREYDRLSALMGGDRAPAQSSEKTGSAEAAAVGVIPPPPAGCIATTMTFSNTTPVPIPDNIPAGITSTINVAGAGASTWDVNVTVNITHTFAADLDFTLMSPAGTVVTLSTDNGGGNDNVFAGTTFDDQADPNSQVEYTGNPNITTDHIYANLVVATPLTPEEPLAAFNGQNPNGTWTLKVVDDLGGDSGTLNSWSLEITTFPSAPTNAAPVTVTNNTPVPIPDNVPAGVTSTINVAGAGASTCDVNVTVNITHTFAADLDFTLTSPSGTVVTLSTDNGGGNDNVFAGTTFDDQADPNSQVEYTGNPNITTDHIYANLVVATPLTPEEPLAAFNGQNPNGTWTLKVVDDLGGDSGTINSWSLTITTCSCAGACSITCPPDITTSNTLDLCGKFVTYPAPTTTGTCGTVTCNPASGMFFPVGTTTVTCTAAVAASPLGDPGAGATFVVPDAKATSAGGGKAGGIGSTSGGIITGAKPTTSNSDSGTPKNSPPSFPQSPFAVLYDQNNSAAPVPGGVTSQNFEASFDAFDSAAADDFVVPAGQTWTVQQVFVVGEYSGPGPATSANVVIYSDSGTLPGAVVYTGTNQAIVDVLADFTITLSPPAVLSPGTYWVAVQANENFSPSGQWFWDNRSTISNAGAAWVNPGGGFGAGCTTFGRKTACLPTQNGPDQLFQILGTSASAGGGSTCTFKVTVVDTQPPTITCPGNITAVTDQSACPAPPCQVVTFPPPVASDNCPGVVVVCNPPSGVCFPTGTTTVTCTATDASGNTASCSFTVTTFDTALQDDSDPSIILLWNSITGQYRFCCLGVTYIGVGKATRQGCIYTLQTPDAADRRLLGRVDKAVHAGSGSLQAPPGHTRCTITDRNTLNDFLLQLCQ